MSAKIILTSVIALSALTFTAPAFAGTPDPDVATVRVSFSDLNLSSEAGATAALHRIEGASSQVCGGEPDPRLLKRQAAYRACMKVAIGRAVAYLNSPIVTALHTGQTSLQVAASR